MSAKRQPYVQSNLTGKSATREFLERFFENCGGPVTTIVRVEGREISRSVSPSLLDTIYGPSPMPMETLFIHKQRQPGKRYIGRAARIASGSNPHEFLWCVKADIKSACLKLDTRSRTILGYLYIADYSVEMISDLLRLSPIAVSSIVDKALERLVAILDGTA